MIRKILISAQRKGGLTTHPFLTGTLLVPWGGDYFAYPAQKDHWKS